MNNIPMANNPEVTNVVTFNSGIFLLIYNSYNNSNIFEQTGNHSKLFISCSFQYLLIIW